MKVAICYQQFIPPPLNIVVFLLKPELIQGVATLSAIKHRLNKNFRIFLVAEIANHRYIPICLLCLGNRRVHSKNARCPGYTQSYHEIQVISG